MNPKNLFKKHTRFKLLPESFLNSLIEHVPYAVWAVDVKENLIIANPVFQNLLKERFGITVYPGLNLKTFNGESIKKLWEKAFKQVLKGKNISSELKRINNEEPFYIEYTASPVYHENKTAGAIFFANDITTRRLAEEAVKESEEKFRQLAENISDSFALIEGEEILYINPAFEKIYGYTKEQLIKNPELKKEWVHPDDRERLKEYISSAHYQISHSFNEQYRIIKPDGSVRWIWNRIHPIRNQDGNIYRILAVASDITPQKELEFKLLKAKTQQLALLDNIPHMAWLKDADGKYISVNESFAKHYHLPLRQIIGKTDRELFPPKQAEEFINKDLEVILSRSQKRIEKATNKNNKRAWSETYKTPIFNEKDELLGITGISIDITDRMKLEEQLRENEERFRSLLQFSSDALTMIDRNGIIIFESSLEGKISGFGINELIGHDVRQLVHPHDIMLFTEAFDDVVQHPGKAVKVEFRGLCKNGNYLFIEGILANYLENKKIGGIVMNSRDVTERKMAEFRENQYQEYQSFLSASALEFLRLSTEKEIFSYAARKLHQFLMGSIIIISSFDDKTSLLTIEETAGLESFIKPIRRILKRDVQGMTFPLTPEIINRLVQNYRSLYKFKNGIREASFDTLSEDVAHELEQTAGMRSVYGITMMRNGKYLGNIVIALLHDNPLTEHQVIETFSYQASIALHRRQVELELIEAKEKAVESDKLKTAFLANMSHEIRTPMNGILGFAQLLSMPGISQAEMQEYVQSININGHLLMNLINDIIDISRIEAGQVTFNPEPVHINALLDEVFRSFLSSAIRSEKRDVSFLLRKGLPDEEALVETDFVRLKQVLNNLLGNAVKFTEKGEIIMGYRKKDDSFLEFYVSDTGIGIAPEKQKIIFERFIQADQSTTRKYGGSGLGLAISKGFVELMGGTIHVTSELSKGSIFSFTLPYKTVMLPSSPSPAQNHTEGQWQNKTVLVIEDDCFSSKYLDMLLKRYGITPVLATNASEGLGLLASHPGIDLVLMDIQLPGLNGYDATHKIKETYPHLPVIAQTANAFDEDRQRTLQAGCDEYITKPIQVDLLLSVLDKYLGKS